MHVCCLFKHNNLHCFYRVESRDQLLRPEQSQPDNTPVTHVPGTHQVCAVNGHDGGDRDQIVTSV